MSVASGSVRGALAGCGMLLLAAAVVASDDQAAGDAIPQKYQERLEAKRRAYGLAGDFDVPPKVSRQKRPEYPKEAFAACVDGDVLLLIAVDAKGSVVDAEVLESIPQLDAAALKAIKGWHFKPAKKAGKPVGTLLMVPVAFRISNKSQHPSCSATPNHGN